MPGEQFNGNGKIFLKITDGTFRQKVEEGTEGAVRREFTNPKTNEAGVAHELVFNSWKGIINRVEIKELSFGKILEIDFGDAVVSIPVDKQYFTDLGAKLPNIVLEKEVTLTPYDFSPNGKKRTGISVVQDGQKIQSYFYDGKKNLHGMPDMKEEQPDKDDWKMYFMKVRKFLVKYIEDNFTKEDLGDGFKAATDEPW